MQRRNIKKKNKTKSTGRKRQVAQLYRYLPMTFKVRLRRRTYDTVSGASAPYYFKLGFLEPLSLVPTYLASLFTMYNRCRIHGSKVTFTLVNTAAEPLELVTNVLPHNWTSGTPTLTELRDKPLSKTGYVSGAGGMDRAIVVNSRKSAAVLGSASYLADFDFDSTQAASTTPIIADEPTWITAVSSFNASTVVSFRLEIAVEWDCEFFDQTAI